MLDRSTILDEIHETLGFVPDLFKRIPDPHLARLWESVRDLKLRPGLLPLKDQQLIMLGVATYARCAFCRELHTQTARSLGSTDDELVETVRLVRHTAELSSYLAASRYELGRFTADVRITCDALRMHSRSRARSVPPRARETVY